MNRSESFAAMLLSVVFAGTVQAAPRPPAKATAGSVEGTTFRIALKLVEVQEDADVNALAIHVHPFQKSLRPHQGDRYHTFTSLSCVQCHALQGPGSKEFFWKTFLIRRDLLKTWVGNTRDVKILAEPVLRVTPGRVAAVKAKSPRKVQYFQRTKNGLFVLKEERVETGISITATVQDAANGSVRLKPLSVSVTAIKGREPIEGVSLPVGKPVLTTTSISTSLLSKLGKSSVISIDSPRGGRVMISVRVSRITRKSGKMSLRRHDDASLLRRVSLDLKGVPPTAAESRAFPFDRSHDRSNSPGGSGPPKGR